MRLHDPNWRGFASDNYSGVHPEVLNAITDANEGHQIAYGEDLYTEKLQAVVKEHFGRNAEAFPVFNGTGANVLALTCLMPRWGAVICSRLAHIHTDEGGAPERVSGLKLFPLTHINGKITPELIDREAFGWGDEHRAQPLVVSITQTTELGTVYTPAEIKAIADHVHSKGMLLHMDGARIWNAASALALPFKAFTTDVGVDILSLGGTKNGLMGAEAIIVLNPNLEHGLKYLRKMNMQLSSKMRFVSAQLLALFENDLGINNARHSNLMAARLRSSLEKAVEDRNLNLKFSVPTDANAVFAVIPVEAADRIREQYRFYDWDRSRGEVRWMCSFDTTIEDIDGFVDLVIQELS